MPFLKQVLVVITFLYIKVDHPVSMQAQMQLHCVRLFFPCKKFLLDKLLIFFMFSREERKAGIYQ